MGIENYSKTPADNDSPVPNGAPEGMAPSGVNNVIRQNMANTRTWYEENEWINLGYTHNYVSGTSFSIASTDYTAVYHIGRRIKAFGSTTGTIYGTITDSSFTTNTTVTVEWDSGSLQNEDLTVSIASLSKVNSTIPYLYKKSGDVASDATIDLNKINGDLIDVTGTTAITAITLDEGQERVIRFADILTLTHSASLILPGSADITTADGDFAILRGYGSGVVRCVSYEKVDGKPINTSVSPSDLPEATTSTKGITYLPKDISISNDSGDPNNDIAFSSGVYQFNDGSGQEIFSGLVKELDNPWAEGDGNGGLFSGTKASNTYYYCYVIHKPANGQDPKINDAGFSPVGPNDIDENDLPTGFVNWEYQGAIRTDSSGNILTGKYNGKRFEYNQYIEDRAYATMSTSPTNLTITAPPSCIALLSAFQTDGNTNGIRVLIVNPDYSDTTPSTTNFTLRSESPGGAEQSQTSQTEVLLDASSQCIINSHVTTTSLQILTRGWIDTNL